MKKRRCLKNCATILVGVVVITRPVTGLSPAPTLQNLPAALRWCSATARSSYRRGTFPKPIIAVIVLLPGGGCELALAYDLRIASETASLASPKSPWHHSEWHARLTRLVAKARRWVDSDGDIIDAKSAYAIGL